MSDKIRVFIAIELNENIQKELARLQNELKTISTKIRWVKPENIHLTLKFLGNLAAEKIEEIKKILLQVGEKTGEFSFSLGSLGVFPNTQNPRVIWVGLKGGRDAAKKLAQALEAHLTEIGFPYEKRDFQPHLTLGRVKSKPDEKFKNLLDKTESRPQNKMTVPKITLFKSTLRPEGAVYEVISEAALTGHPE